MKKHKAILLGWVNQRNVPQCGETVKNQYIIRQLKELGVDLTVLDFFQWRKHPLVLLKTLWALCAHPGRPLILSTSFCNVYPLAKVHKWIRSKRNIIHWTIGGKFHENVHNGIFKAKYIRPLNINLVESDLMVESLRKDGIESVRQVPNFKEVKYLPKLHAPDEITRFVFISRIKPEKGVDYIFRAASILNDLGMESKYIVDFYGRIDEDYVELFNSQCAKLPNVNYKGFLNMSDKEGIDRLAQYDAMLFPTYWEGEGFAGIFVDAFVAGLPIIATDWAHNRVFLSEDETALFVPIKDAEAIAGRMKAIMDGDIDLMSLKRHCQETAMGYDIDNVITPQLLREIGLL